MEVKQKKEILWYDHPNVVTSLIIGLISVIIILSQSFAINHNLSTGAIFRNIINHNSIYFISLVYFVALKTHTGKKYFNFLNLFLILFYFVTSITALLTVFQTFSLSTLISLALHVVILVYLFHTFLRKTRVWKEFKLDNSPFNEIRNDAYFYVVVVLEVALLSLNLIFSNSLDGTILSLLDTCYVILFARYVYLYGYFLDKKENKKDMHTSLEEVHEAVNKVMDEVTEKVEEATEKIGIEISKNVKRKLNGTSSRKKEEGK